jgi:PleD family two-component response regulator
MSNKLSLFFVLGALVAASGWFMAGANRAFSDDKTKKDVPDAKRDLEQSTFMRKKLEASGQILEGLTVEDAELIVKGAKILVELSAAERFQVQHDVMYRQFSGEFQRTAKGLLEAAEKKNFDLAALKWMDTTMKCLECHKFVRGTRIADSVR